MRRSDKTPTVERAATRSPGTRRGSSTVPSRLGQVLVLLLLGGLWAGGPPHPLGGQQPSPADGMVRGVVLDDRTGAAVVAATVDLLDEVGRIRARAVTDGEGAFVLARLAPGPFRLRVRSVGYEEVISPRWWIETGEVLTVRLRVDVSAIPLAPLEVVARARSASPVLDRFYERMARGLSGVFLDREAIEARNPMRITDLLADIPGLTFQGVADAGDPRRDLVVAFSRAPGACPAQVYVDGVAANRGRTTVPLDALASPGVLEGIEVYRGLSGVPPEFLSPEARCGVIALWTRRGGSPFTPDPREPERHP